MIKTVAVGTDGSDTAAKAVEFALELASRYEAKIVFLSAYRAVSEDRLKRESRDAPEDVQWQINPAEDVEPALRDAEDEARERGLETTSEAKEGDASKVLVDLAEQAQCRRARDRQQGHVAQGARQRAEHGQPQGRLLRGDRQDDMSDIERRPSRTPRRAREQRAYRLVQVGGGAALVAVVGLILSIAGVIGSTLWVIAAIVAAVCAAAVLAHRLQVTSSSTQAVRRRLRATLARSKGSIPSAGAVNTARPLWPGPVPAALRAEKPSRTPDSAEAPARDLLPSPPGSP